MSAPARGSRMGQQGSTGSPGSRAWRLSFRAMYRLIRLLDPVIRAAWRLGLPGIARTVELRLAGRRSGRPRHTLVTLLTVDRNQYVGHPNGPAPWTRNLEAAADTVVARGSGTHQRVRAVRVWAGPEREAIIRATWSQQPFPANVVYRLARDHIRQAGVYYRLVEVSSSADAGKGAS